MHLPLTIALALSGDLTARLDQAGASLTLTAIDEGTALRYTDLVAYDVGGKQLRAWLEVHGDRLVLKADDAGARYPVTIDPFMQLAELTASDGGTIGDSGNAVVAISGNTVVVGALNANGANPGQGAAYVFVKPATGWANMTQTAKLAASDGQERDALGTAVAISGDTVVAGAPNATVNGQGVVGAAYVFVKPPGGWADMTQTAKLTNTNGEYSVGFSVEISGNTVAVGVGASPYFQSPGQVDVFVKPASGWVDMTQTAELTESVAGPYDVLGWSVSLSGDTIAAGAPGWNNNQQGEQNGQGAVFLFVKPSSGWANMTENAELLASDGVRGDQLGSSVSISGNTVLAGAPNATVGFNEYQGTAYVFVRPARGWADGYQTAKLTLTDGQPLEGLGYSVSTSGTTAIVGAPFATVGANQLQGVAYLYRQPAGGWKNMTQTSQLVDAAGLLDEEFGSSVSVSGRTPVSWIRSMDLARGIYTGAAFVFGP